MADRGYSGRPLATKIGVKPGHRVVLLHAPQDWGIPDLPQGAQVAAGEVVDADIVLGFYRARSDLVADVPGFVDRLPPATMLWIAWPRRAAGHDSDITENGLRELLLPTGLVDVKVAALGEDWSGLKFVWRVERRDSRS